MTKKELNYWSTRLFNFVDIKLFNKSFTSILDKKEESYKTTDLINEYNSLFSIILLVYIKKLKEKNIVQFKENDLKIILLNIDEKLRKRADYFYLTIMFNSKLNTLHLLNEFIIACNEENIRKTHKKYAKYFLGFHTLNKWPRTSYALGCIYYLTNFQMIIDLNEVCIVENKDLFFIKEYKKIIQKSTDCIQRHFFLGDKENISFLTKNYQNILNNYENKINVQHRSIYNENYKLFIKKDFMKEYESYHKKPFFIRLFSIYSFISKVKKNMALKLIENEQKSDYELDIGKKYSISNFLLRKERKHLSINEAENNFQALSNKDMINFCTNNLISTIYYDYLPVRDGNDESFFDLFLDEIRLSGIGFSGRNEVEEFFRRKEKPYYVFEYNKEQKKFTINKIKNIEDFNIICKKDSQ